MTVEPTPHYVSSPTEDTALVSTHAIVLKSSSDDSPRPTQKFSTTTARQMVVSAISTSTLDRIAFCESQNDPTAKNPRSSASGRFQFLTSSWEAYGRQLWGSTEGKDVFSYKDNTELAEYVVSKVGYSPWNSSKSCWKQ